MTKRGNILITGITGFTGRHAAKYFSSEGYEVIGVSRNYVPIHNIKIETCDLSNKLEVTNLLKKINPEFILHLAGQNHVGRSWEEPLHSLEANSLSTAYLIEAARQYTNVKKIVVVGSVLQFNPDNLETLKHPYSLSKTLQCMIAQSWSRLYQVPVVVAKPTNLIGPGYSNGICSIIAEKVAVIEKKQAEPLINVNNLYATRDFLDVRDAVRAYDVLCKHGEVGQIYDITTGFNRTLKDVTDYFLNNANVDFEVKAKEAIIEESYQIEPAKLKNLDWKPLISFEASLQDTLNFYRNKLK
ncbi:NAD-dependent epimerase/dehydratase family protein [Metabacillus malikii]|uniref:GDP-4-dehydro-6-deoxy-D-mannose reductase n=1 Tax=Metabacillus malikii TaxID=1504265 RepID=A0ABT9ZJP0_9BACI|nr:NAD-dependent epimerase/dehydratase family protein [Metabacillus malikii]MDQ0232509.1 GDP-4-dehydro-6-deoxy-D-mannose reductase [Metabacillus malikii]